MRDRAALSTRHVIPASIAEWAMMPCCPNIAAGALSEPQATPCGAALSGLALTGVLVGIRGTDFCRADVGTDHRLSHRGRSDNHSSSVATSAHATSVAAAATVAASAHATSVAVAASAHAAAASA